MSNSPASVGADSAVDIYDEFPRRTLTEAARREGKGPSTVWRWALKGCRGVKLETFLHGGVRCTTDPALRRFFDAINGASPLSAQPRTNRQREAAISRAERELRQAGV